MMSYARHPGFAFVNEAIILGPGEKTVQLTLSKSSGPVNSGDIRKLTAYFYGLVASRPGQGMSIFNTRNFVKATYQQKTTAMELPGFVLEFHPGVDLNFVAQVL